MNEIPIYSIGYGNRTIEAFLEILDNYDISYLIDVRSRPFSKYNPNFSRPALKQWLNEKKIMYLFMGDTLGGLPEDTSCYTDGKVDYEKLKTKTFFTDALKRIENAFHQQNRVMIMCSEGKPENCHRTKLISEELALLDVTVCHIDENALEKNQEEIMDRLTGGQLSFWGLDDVAEKFIDPKLTTSRKKYLT